jgi:hypothetical protein
MMVAKAAGVMAMTFVVTLQGPLQITWFFSPLMPQK